MIETYHRLELDPDIMLIDGNGRLHPRRMGLACHVGLSLDKPTIGVAKNLLTGEIQGDDILLNGEKLAKIMETKNKAKPIYISQGHKVSLSKALEITKACSTVHKLPEPLHQAHKLANKVRRKIKGKE